MMTHKPKDADAVGSDFDGLPATNPQKTVKKTSLSALTQNDHDLWKGVAEAVSEKDVSELRFQLRKITQENPVKTSFPDDYFNLTEKMDFREFLYDNEPDMPLSEIPSEPLPRIHIHQHKRNSFESTWQFYDDQTNVSSKQADPATENETDKEWSEIQEALQEKDVMSLRDKVSHITATGEASFYALEDIENYCEGKLNADQRIRFEEELRENSELKADLTLHIEMQQAVSEIDIMKLRESLSTVIQSQNSTSKSIEEIESFLDGAMDESERTSFINELIENKGLRDEVKLVQEVNASFAEKSVMKMRENLQQIAKNIRQQQIRSFLSLRKDGSGIGKASIVAAVIVLTFGIISLLGNTGGSGRNLYDRFYKVPETHTYNRSSVSDMEIDLKKGFEYYQKKDFNNALTHFLRVLESDNRYPVAQFYSGISYQNMKQLQNAIPHYENVIRHNNSLFLEQATWFCALCRVGIGDTRDAVNELKEIIRQNGYYANDARQLLRKLQ